jgi:hypothetical protein
MINHNKISYFLILSFSLELLSCRSNGSFWKQVSLVYFLKKNCREVPTAQSKKWCCTQCKIWTLGGSPQTLAVTTPTVSPLRFHQFLDQHATYILPYFILQSATSCQRPPDKVKHHAYCYLPYISFKHEKACCAFITPHPLHPKKYAMVNMQFSFVCSMDMFWLLYSYKYILPNSKNSPIII